MFGMQHPVRGAITKLFEHPGASSLPKDHVGVLLELLSDRDRADDSPTMISQGQNRVYSPRTKMAANKGLLTLKLPCFSRAIVWA